MNITPEEAAQALHEIESSKMQMRKAILAYNGHLYLWIWGVAWAAMSTLGWLYGSAAHTAFNVISAVGTLASFGIASVQSRRIRSTIDPRFPFVCISLIAFGFGVWPWILGGFTNFKAAYAYSCLVWMQIYVVAGIWFDSFLLWVGLLVTILALIGLLVLQNAFWALMLVNSAVLIASGFHVRNLRK